MAYPLIPGMGAAGENLKKVKNPVLRLEAKAIGGGRTILKLRMKLPHKTQHTEECYAGCKVQVQVPGLKLCFT